MKAVTPHLRRSRRRWSSALTLVALAAAVFFMAASASGNLTVGTFDAGNGDLTDTTNHDWNPVGSPASNKGPIEPITCPGSPPGAGTNCATDLVNSGSDNALGQGAKEDDTTVSVVDGSIPPQKDDLSRFYVNQETGSNGHNLLYLAWERTNLLGSAHMDFELNQKGVEDFGLDASSTGSVTLNRTAGDVLISFDFGGSGEPTLVWHKWVTTDTATGTPSTDCEASNAFPCWGKGIALDASKVEAEVNGAPVKDYNAPVPAAGYNTLNGTTTSNKNSTTISSTFGEAGIDLQAAGIFDTFSCKNFGVAWLKSRSSGSSFTSELKDFIAPLPVNISNCGTIKIIKHTDARGVDKSFGYSTDVPSGTATNAATFSKAPTTTGATTEFSLNDSAGVDNTTNTETITNVVPGTYKVTETVPDGWSLESLVCDPTSDSLTSYGVRHASDSPQADVTIAADGLVTCTYTNKRNTASLATSVSSAGPLSPGTQVRDTATVTGSVSTLTPSGTVTFYLCRFDSGSTDVCNGSDAAHTGTSIGTGTLSGSGTTATANSPYRNTSGTPLAAGRYCFRAEWPGDTNYVYADGLKEWGGSSGTGECFTVEKIDSQTATTPVDGSGVDKGTITLGSTIYDKAVVTGNSAGGDPSGSVTFYVCNLATGTCSSDGTQVGSAKTLVSDGEASTYTSSATSDGYTPASPGRYCFRGEYGGSSYYNTSSDSSEGECFTVTDDTSMSSAQNWLPNDSATVTATHGAPLTGTLTIQLYTGGTCEAGKEVAGQLYTKNLSAATSSADRTLATDNSTYKVSATATVSWKVVFTSSSTYVTGSNRCESSSLTVTN